MATQWHWQGGRAGFQGAEDLVEDVLTFILTSIYRIRIGSRDNLHNVSYHHSSSLTPCI